MWDIRAKHEPPVDEAPLRSLRYPLPRPPYLFEHCLPMTSEPAPEPLIVVVEAEAHLATGLIFNLQAEGYRTHHESDGDSALAWLLAASESGPDAPAAILLDCMLPG